MERWHEPMLDNLISYFETDEDILGLLLFGSCSRPGFADDWSDIDILVLVENEKLDRFFPNVDWITAFGKLYTYSQSADDFKFVTRACFEDFRRIDFVITTEEKLAKIDRWPGVPFFSGTRLLLSRSEILDQTAGRGSFPYTLSLRTEAQFQEMVRDFRFKSMQAVYKVVRNDLLVALHLAQDLIRDCCVLGMVLRDRATGTNIHKTGGLGNQVVARLESAQKPFTPYGILESIQESNELFEKLAAEWSGTYEETRHLLRKWIERARVGLAE